MDVVTKIKEKRPHNREGETKIALDYTVKKGRHIIRFPINR